MLLESHGRVVGEHRKSGGGSERVIGEYWNLEEWWDSNYSTGRVVGDQ